jgi:hypothetical protein
MPSPFPGVDPYLENPEYWSELHHRLITAIAIDLSLPLRPKYQVAIEKRTYFSTPEDTVLVGIPDASVYRGRTQKASTQQQSSTAISTVPIQVEVPMLEEVREAYLEIRENITKKVITLIEVLSPKNKRSGEGRIAYEKKRQQILSSETNLVEIDFLRSLPQMPILKYHGVSDYRILVSRANRRPLSDLYPFSIRDRIPAFLFPLQTGDNEPVLDLQILFNQIYDQAGYDLRIDYKQAIIPGLSTQDQVWADDLLANI